MMKTDLTRERIAFGGLLKALRTKRRLTLQDLEKRTGIKYSATGAIENGRRAAGNKIAERLADGLMLRDDEREDFLIKASTTRCNGPYSAAALQLGVQVLRAVDRCEDLSMDK